MMISFLNEIDTKLFLYLNNNFHSDWFDQVMLGLSYNVSLMAILILGLTAFGFYHFKKYFFIGFFFLLVSFGLSDSISSRIFKPGFERLRPCHNPVLADKVHLAKQKCGGGKFGFFSSHASNSFAIAMFFWLLFRKKSSLFGLLFVHASLVSYSRIYLARHYPGDIIFGCIFGLLCAWIGYKLFTKSLDRLAPQFLNQQ